MLNAGAGLATSCRAGKLIVAVGSVGEVGWCAHSLNAEVHHAEIQRGRAAAGLAIWPDVRLRDIGSAWSIVRLHIVVCVDLQARVNRAVDRRIDRGVDGDVLRLRGFFESKSNTGTEPKQQDDGGALGRVF